MACQWPDEKRAQFSPDTSGERFDEIGRPQATSQDTLPPQPQARHIHTNIAYTACQAG